MRCLVNAKACSRQFLGGNLEKSTQEQVAAPVLVLDGVQGRKAGRIDCQPFREDHVSLGNSQINDWRHPTHVDVLGREPAAGTTMGASCQTPAP